MFVKQLCEPVKKLPKCRFFRDMTWSLISNADNITEQIVHCHCPRGSVAYLIKRQAFQVNSGIGYKYSFACSPQSVSFFIGLIHFLKKPYSNIFFFFFTEIKVSKKRTLQTFHREKKTRKTRRSQHEYLVSVFSCSQVSETSHGSGSFNREIIRGRSHSYLQRILHANTQLK